jgi:hypothetical protein
LDHFGPFLLKSFPCGEISFGARELQVPSSSGVNKLGGSCTMPRCDKRREGFSNLLVHDHKGWKWVILAQYYSHFLHFLLQIYGQTYLGCFGSNPKTNHEGLQSNMKTMRPTALGI